MPPYEAGTLFAPSPDELKALDDARTAQIAAAAESQSRRRAAGQAAAIEARISVFVEKGIRITPYILASGRFG